MIVQCPSCSTGFHLGAGPAAGVVLRCSRCLVAFPCPTHRRSYALGPGMAPAPAPARHAILEPMPEPVVEPIWEPVVEPLVEPMVEVVAPEPSAPRAVAGPRRTSREMEPAAASRVDSLLPLGLAAAFAAGAWFAAPFVPAAWMPPVLLPLERWILSAGGAGVGLVLSGLWLAWRAARR